MDLEMALEMESFDCARIDWSKSDDTVQIKDIKCVYSRKLDRFIKKTLKECVIRNNYCVAYFGYHIPILKEF